MIWEKKWLSDGSGWWWELQLLENLIYVIVIRRSEGYLCYVTIGEPEKYIGMRTRLDDAKRFALRYLKDMVDEIQKNLDKFQT